MSKPVGDYDVISFVCMWKTEYVEGDMLTELEPFFEDPTLAYPDYDFDDLVPAYVDNTGRVGGEKIYLGGPGSKLYAVPLGAETSVLAYRKDLFEEHNIKVPETYDEVRAAAKYFAENVEKVKKDRQMLTEQLRELKFDVPDSFSNFVLTKTKDGKAADVYEKLVQRNIYVRYFDLPGLSDKLRITVGTSEQNDKLISALKEILSD